MLNQDLQVSFLQKSLGNYVDTIDLILQDILGVQKHPLINNKKILGLIHHALNISNYKKSDFRYKLLFHAPDEPLKDYFQSLGWGEKGISDPRTRLKLINKASRLKWTNNEETKSFVKIFGYEDNLVPLSTKPPHSIETIETYGVALKTLWEYQSRIFYQGIDLVERKYTRFIIQMPTGAGKTRTAMETICHFLNNGIDQREERRVIWLADKEELCEQAVESFTHVWPHIGKAKAKIYRFWGSSKISNFESNSFIVATYGKINNLLKNGGDIPKPDLIICDEAHNAIAQTYKSNIEKLAENGARIIGLTATPVRGIETEENNELKEFFDNKILDIQIDENVIEYLQRKGFLSFCIAETIDTHIKFRIPSNIWRLMSVERDLPPTFLQQLSQNNERNLVIARLLKKLGEEGSKVLYFAPTVEQSKLMCGVLITLGYNAAHIDGTTPKEYRRDIIEKFKLGKIKFVCNFNVFTTGFDDPEIDTIVIGRPTKSIVLHQQMIGRGMRGPKMRGTTTFKLYRIKDELPGIELADQYFKEVWKQ